MEKTALMMRTYKSLPMHCKNGKSQSMEKEEGGRLTFQTILSKFKRTSLSVYQVLTQNRMKIDCINLRTFKIAT